MSEVNMVNAKEAYDLLCRTYDKIGLKYEKREEELIIISSMKGDDFPVEFIVSVDPERNNISFVSWLPFEAPEAKRVDMAIAVCTANYGLANGSFDYKISDGSIMFRLTSCYKGCAVSEELFEYMLIVSVGTVDKYNDKFFMIAKDMMTIQQFIESEQNS